MAGKVLKAGIRFNDPNLKYMSFAFNQDQNNCTIIAELVVNGSPIKVFGTVGNWLPVENEANTVGATRTTAKKTVKESK